MKKIFTIITILLMVTTMVAQEKSKKEKYALEVSGNCGSCKKRIEKAAYKVKGVKSAIWNKNDKVLHLIYNARKTDINTIAHKIAAVGHDSELAKTTKEVYNKLNECCQYQRKDCEIKKGCCARKQ